MYCNLESVSNVCWQIGLHFSLSLFMSCTIFYYPTTRTQHKLLFNFTTQTRSVSGPNETLQCGGHVPNRQSHLAVDILNAHLLLVVFASSNSRRKQSTKRWTCESWLEMNIILIYATFDNGEKKFPRLYVDEWKIYPSASAAFDRNIKRTHQGHVADRYNMSVDHFGSSVFSANKCGEMLRTIEHSLFNKVTKQLQAIG